MATAFLVSSTNTSKKYALFSAGVCVLQMVYECTEHGCTVRESATDGNQHNQGISQSEFDTACVQAANKAIAYCQSNRLPVMTEAVIRVAVPGTFFQSHRLITSEYKAELQNQERVAPIQVLPVLRELKYLDQVLPEVALYAASDTAFHATMPPHARNYSLNPELADALDVYKFGTNGLSVSSVVGRVHSIIGLDPERMVVCHLDNHDLSVTAVAQGKSVDTTVGFAPASGFPTGAEAGDVDTAAALRIMKRKNLRATDAEVFLHTQGGVQALAGTTDVSVLLKQANQHEPMAMQALDLFVYKIQQAIAAALAALDGVQVIVFTGPLSLRSPELRTRILQQFSYVQLYINEERNSAICGKGGVISARNSAVKAVVLKSDELSEMNAAVKNIQLNHASKAAWQ